jgi:hypothetical protein
MESVGATKSERRSTIANQSSQKVLKVELHWGQCGKVKARAILWRSEKVLLLSLFTNP